MTRAPWPKNSMKLKVSLVKATRPRVTATASALVVGFWGHVATWQVFTRKLYALTLKLGVRRFESLASSEVGVEVDVLSAMRLRHRTLKGGLSLRAPSFWAQLVLLLRNLRQCLLSSLSATRGSTDEG